MEAIHHLKISKMFPHQTYLKGVTYYEDGRVSDLLYDLNFQTWTANVFGSQMYFVEIDFYKLDHGLIEAFCECPAFKAYDSCKHIVAVLLAIRKHVESYAWDYGKNKYVKAEQFMEGIVANKRQNHLYPLNKLPLHVEYYCSFSDERNLYLELKIGPQRCFVVRNVYDFLDDIFNEREHFFTKTFTYRPDHHYILEKDLRIFEMIYLALKNEKMYQQSLDTPDHHYRKRQRKVLIPLLYIDDLLKQLSERSLFVQYKNYLYEDIKVIKGELPFSFSLVENKQDELSLQICHMEEGIYLPAYDLFFKDGIFYVLTKEQSAIVHEISHIGVGDTQLPIPKKEADTLLSEVIPSLEKIGTVKIDENIAKQMIQAPLQAKLYLDLKGNWLIGKLFYQYGSYTFDPFHFEELSETMIIRDAQEEQIIMSLIEHANFRYNGEDLYIEIEHEEQLYEFLYDMLPTFENHVELFLTETTRKLFIEPEPSANITVPSDSKLLEVSFEMDGIDTEEIQHILQAVVEKERYYRMPDGAFLSLEGAEFSSVRDLLVELNIQERDLQDGKITMPAYRGVQIDELMTIQKNYDSSFEKLLAHLRSPTEQVYELPKNLQATLRPYQKTGYQWFKSLSSYHFGGILADDMGLGKTIQTIAYLLSEPRDKPHLVVVPSSVLYNWKNECRKFAPDLQVVTAHGTPEERKEILNQAENFDVWITSYATLRQDIEHYRKLKFQTLILDEAQYIKNYQTKTSRAIRHIQATRRFALSGTPIENSIDELWAIFQVILPGFLPNLQTFRKFSHEKIAQLTKPFILRRVKQDVLTELPEKIETVHVSELTKAQKQLYLGYLQETSRMLDEGEFQQNRMQVLAGITRLRQICCHPSLFIENYSGGSGKFTQLLELINSSLASGKRLLIFSQFTSMHQMIAEQLRQRGLDYFYLHGQTSSKERISMSERFNCGEKDIFLISLRAGGTGLNLTGADTVILYDLWWNPAVEDQATGRAHRFGQKNVVQVIRLLTEGTIEEKIYELQQQKRKLIDQIVQPGETLLSSLSEEDVRKLLSL